jgi:DNA-directed RNA polymerase specialized sigma24 family protein
MAGSVTCVLDPYAADRSAALGELARLSDPQRNVLGRAFFHELTYEQIAACTGLRLGTVKSQILGGLLRLRTRLRVDRES